MDFNKFQDTPYFSWRLWFQNMTSGPLSYRDSREPAPSAGLLESRLTLTQG